MNEGIISTQVGTFGGVKESGFGPEDSKYGIEDYRERKPLCLGDLADGIRLESCEISLPQNTINRRTAP